MTGTKPVLTRIIVSGTVQGVFFRAKTQKHAENLGLKGYVKNLPDGTVEIGIVGTETAPLLSALQKEPPPIEIDTIEISTETLTENYTSFSILG